MEVKINKDAKPDQLFAGLPKMFSTDEMFGATLPLHAQKQSHQSKKFVITSGHALTIIVHADLFGFLRAYPQAPPNSRHSLPKPAHLDIFSILD